MQEFEVSYPFLNLAHFEAAPNGPRAKEASRPFPKSPHGLGALIRIGTLRSYHLFLACEAASRCLQSLPEITP